MALNKPPSSRTLAPGPRPPATTPLQNVLSDREQQVLDPDLACCPAEKNCCRLEISVANVHSITYRLRQTISAIARSNGGTVSLAI